MKEKRLADIITSRVINISPTNSVADAIKVLENNKISCVIILAEERPVGILTEHKIITSVQQRGTAFMESQVQEIMSSPVITADKDLNLHEAYHLLASEEIRHLVVVDAHGLAMGVLTLSNIIDHLGYEYFVDMRKVSKIMTRSVMSIPKESIVADAINEMAKNSLGCLIISENNHPFGIVTERDIIRLLGAGIDIKRLKIEEVMNSPVQTISEDTSVLDATETMRRKKIRRVVIVNQNGNIVGLATQSNIIQGLESKYIKHLKQIVKEKDKTLEETLRELAEKSAYFDNILRSSTDIGIVSTDINGRIVYYNPIAGEILGYPADEIIGRDLWEIHHQVGLDLARLDTVLAAVRQKSSHTYSYVRRNNYGKRYIEARVSRILDQEDNLSGYVLILRDTTERKLAEDKLRASEERFRLTFEYAKDAMFWANTKTGILINCNKAAELLLEKEREEIIGHHCTTIHPPDKSDFYAAMLKKNFERGGSVDNEAEVLTKSGKRIPVSITASKTVIGGETIIQGIYRDISERKRVEEALRENEKKYSSLVENSLTGIYINQGKKIVFANKKFADMYGYRKEELKDILVWKLIHPKDRALTNRMRVSRLKGLDVPQEYEARGLTKSGKTIWIKRRNSLITYNGKPAILGNVVDITERKKAEEKLHKLNEELKDFVRVVSHELKNPLVAIQGFSTRLIKHYQDVLEKKGRDYLEHINTNAQRMNQLVSDLLTFSKIGRVASTFRTISTYKILKNIIPSLQVRMDERGIQFFIADNLPSIYCEQERIHQVFENLLTNSVKYMGNTADPRIEIGYEDKGEFHQFFVRDNGRGIEPKHHPDIFKRFHRLNTEEDQEGTGLGLAIVERIVKNHGGKIWIESEKGSGASFYFTLPKKYGHERPEERIYSISLDPDDF